MTTIVLLTISNIFMTFAWYGHLKYQNVPLWKVTLISWGIAFFEYCFQVPANRIGSHSFNPAQLKTIQEIITLVVFSVFSICYLKRGHQVEPRGRIFLHRGGGVLYFQEVVELVAIFQCSKFEIARSLVIRVTPASSSSARD